MNEWMKSVSKVMRELFFCVVRLVCVVLIIFGELPPPVEVGASQFYTAPIGTAPWRLVPNLSARIRMFRAALMSRFSR